jgi:hypothetical protein
VAAYAWETSFADTDYHTQFDTLDMIDADVIAAQARLYSLLLLSADSDPDGVLDHQARAKQLAKIAASAGHPQLAEAALAHAGARGRAAFTTVGRHLFALDSGANSTYPHEQTQSDLASLDKAIAALDAGLISEAARALSKVGLHRYARYLSEETYNVLCDRLTPEAVARSWGAACHLTQSPRLWAELASLRGERSARPIGPWVRSSLVLARTETHQAVTDRLTAMAAAIAKPSEKG